MCHLVARGIYIRWQHLIFLLFLYVVQLYKEDWTILQMLEGWACSPEQWFQLFSANTTQTQLGNLCCCTVCTEGLLCEPAGEGVWKVLAPEL